VPVTRLQRFIKLRCEKLAPHKGFAVRNADPHVCKRLSPKFYQLRRNQRTLPSSASVPVTFVLDSVVTISTWSPDRDDTPVVPVKAAEDWAMGLELLVSEEFNSGDY
jgi:hypothetical protein